jgi:hypothetical protein
MAAVGFMTYTVIGVVRNLESAEKLCSAIEKDMTLIELESLTTNSGGNLVVVDDETATAYVGACRCEIKTTGDVVAEAAGSAWCES